MSGAPPVHRFSLTAPPVSGKTSRQEKVSRSGRASFSGIDQLVASITPTGGSTPIPASNFGVISEDPFAPPQEHRTRRSSAAVPPAVASPPRKTSAPPVHAAPNPALDFFSSAPVVSEAAGGDIFSFFDPLADKPAPKPVAAAAADPFSAAFAHGVHVTDPFGNDAAPDPFSAAPPAQHARKSSTAAVAAPRKSSVAAPPPAAADSSSESDSSSDSDSDSDDDGKAKRPKRVKKPREVKIAAGLVRATQGQSASASSAAATANKSIANPAASATAAAEVVTGEPAPTHSVLKVDVLAYMRKGTPFLKYGKSGYPHFRQFQLSPDNSSIIWFSENKKAKDTQLALASVEALRTGQTTANFARHPAPDLDSSSFSLIYGNGKLSLDLIAKDPNEFRIWHKGLGMLLDVAASSPHLLEKLSVVLDMTVNTTRRSSIDIVDVSTGKTAAAIGASQPNAEARPRAMATNNKAMAADVSKQLETLKHKLHKRRDELKEHRFYASEHNEAMQNIVKKVQDSVVKSQEMFQDGDYAEADDEIWRASVDLESLKNMMKAIR